MRDFEEKLKSIKMETQKAKVAYSDTLSKELRALQKSLESGETIESGMANPNICVSSCQSKA